MVESQCGVWLSVILNMVSMKLRVGLFMGVGCFLAQVVRQLLDLFERFFFEFMKFVCMQDLEIWRSYLT